MTARILNHDEHADWDRWLSGLDHANMRQSSVYQPILALYGHESEIVVIEHGGRFVAGAVLSSRRPNRLVGPIVHTAGGIALSDLSDPDLLDAALGAILDRCADLGSSTVTVNLRVPMEFGEEAVPGADQFSRVLRERGFSASETMGTYYVDISGDSEDEILSRCSRNTRRQIRKAFRAGLVVEPSLDLVDFEDFESAHRSMGARKGLAALPEGIGVPLHQVAQRELGALFVARYEGAGINYAVLSTTGHPVPHWAALRDARPDRACPGSGHAMHFAAMMHFQARGKRYYDFGGAEGAIPDKAHPNYGVWRFKYEFGGVFALFVGGWRRNLKPVQALIVDMAKRGLAVKSPKDRE